MSIWEVIGVFTLAACVSYAGALAVVAVIRGPR